MLPQKRPEKNQTERLIDFLEGVRTSGVNFLDAFRALGIQDLRKRLCEVRELGYRLKSFERFVDRSSHIFESGGPVAVTHWALDPVFQTGHYVRIEAPAVFPNGRHPLKGALGTILGKENHQYIVGDHYGQPIGRFRHKDLHLVGAFAKGSTVSLTGATFTVAGFEPRSGDYIVQNTEGDGYLLSPELLRRPTPPELLQHHYPHGA